MSWDERSLTAFMASAQTGSFGRAARQMNMTQPAMTRIVRRLEDHLGVRLFERRATGIGLTIFGEAFLPYASLVLAEIGNARSLLQSLSGASKGVIRVGGVGAANSGHLAGALFALLKRQPALQIQVIEEIEDKLLLALKKGEIDLAVSPETYLDDEITLACDETLHDVVEVYAAPSHPLAGGAGAGRGAWRGPARRRTPRSPANGAAVSLPPGSRQSRPRFRRARSTC